MPVVAGLALATIGTMNEAKAQSQLSDAPIAGHCVGGGICGTTSGGTTLYGK